MTPRLTAALWVSALIRRVNQEGGNAMILAKGDATAGSILLICMEKGVVRSVRERLLDRGGSYAWTVVGPSELTDLSDYLDRRLRRRLGIEGRATERGRSSTLASGVGHHRLGTHHQAEVHDADQKKQQDGNHQRKFNGNGSALQLARRPVVNHARSHSADNIDIRDPSRMNTSLGARRGRCQCFELRRTR